MSFCSLISVILFSLWMYFHLWFNFLFFSFLSFITSVKGDNLDVLIYAFYRWDSLFISVLLNLLLTTSNGTKCYLVTLYLILEIYYLLWQVLCGDFCLWNHVLCKEYHFDSFNSILSVLYFCILPDYLDKNIRILRSMRMKADSLALFHRYVSLFSKMLMFVDLWPHLW